MMKKINIILFYLIMTMIPLYFILLWNPNKDEVSVDRKELLQEETVETVASIDNSNDLIMLDDSNDNEEVVLRMSITNIINEMDSNSKKRVKRILYKLPISDYEKIKALMNRDDKEEAVIEFVKLLQKRLDSSDYEEFKAILSPYINFEVI